MLEAVEAGGPLKYIRCGHYPAGAAVEVLSAGSEIPSLGRATTYNASTSETFVVSEPEAVIALRPIGTDRVSVDQLLNPDTVTFTPSGIWNDDIVLYGRVATVSDSGPAQKLMRRFHAANEKTFHQDGGVLRWPPCPGASEGWQKTRNRSVFPSRFRLASGLRSEVRRLRSTFT